MSWPATVRYDLEPAPGGLGLVQDLLNTVAAGAPREPDLLDDLEQAQAWVNDAAAQWSAVTGQPVPQVVLDPGGLEELRAFRDDLHRLTATAHDAVPEDGMITTVLHTGTAALQLGEDGLVRLEPRGTGWRRLASLILVATFEGQRADTRRRLKTCRNPRCRAAFYDRSRNNSGVWHDVKACGNAANLRAYRARQRAKST
jgi:predicted RNA-binding Zn ribbon-like protein